jgi:hypothetical protein
MKLQEIFDQLRGTEFSMLSIGGQPQGVINEANQEIVLNTLNLGLNNLHTRFNLREGQLKLLLLPELYLYSLKSSHQVENRRSRETVRYIDSVFPDDLAKVEQLLTASGQEVGLNDKSRYACSTPSSHVLRVHPDLVNQPPDMPDAYRTTYLDVVYRATHPRIDAGIFDLKEADLIDVELPYLYLEPLLYFMASRVHHPKGMTGDMQLGASYAAKYEQACQRLEISNLQIDWGQENTRMGRNGWV